MEKEVPLLALQAEFAQPETLRVEALARFTPKKIEIIMLANNNV